METIDTRLRRIMTAIELGRPDRVPAVLEYSGFAAHATGTLMADFLSSPARATEVMLQAYDLVGGGDAINYGTFSPYHLATLFGAKVRVPGHDLPPDEMWQVVEEELLRPEDYDLILEMGWPDFFTEFLEKRVFVDAREEILPHNLKPVDVRREWAEAGLPVLAGGDVTAPLELLCGGRSLLRFAQDCYAFPEKVERVMDEIAPHLAPRAIGSAKERGYPLVWVGGWRSAPSMLSPAMWDRFAWPYLRALTQEVVDSGLIALLHLDSGWDRELARFRELPGGRCILALDGETDIRLAKKKVGDHLCIMGDVPAGLLFTGSAEEVREYCRGLIRDIGPEGFILQSGCDIPTNAKVENVRAMVQAVLD